CSVIFCFFFSSRRRHTRFSRDWSSDVCSSDLLTAQLARQLRHPFDQTPQLTGQRILRQQLGEVLLHLAEPVGGGAQTAEMGEVRSEERRVGKECRCRWATDQ